MPPNAGEPEHFFMETNGSSIEELLDINSTRSLRPDGISVHITTFNCANTPHPDLPIALPLVPPDLLIVGLQELAPSHIAFLDLPVVNNYYLKGLDGVPGAAFKQYGKEYKLVKVVRIGQTALIIWSPLGKGIKRVQTAWAGCGVFGLLANKGAAAARLTVVKGIPPNVKLTEGDGTERDLTFVSAHLAAREGHFDRRNADFRCLVENLVFKDQTGIFKPNAPLFFFGDLNYRLSVLHPSRSGSSLTLSPGETADDVSLVTTLKGQILDFLETGQFSHLVPHDQLPLSPLAVHLNEVPITFSPTYKYSSHSPPTYASNRTPSWTDRILFSPETLFTRDYKSITCATFSDHQAVCLTAIIRDEDFKLEEGVMPWAINPRWRQRRRLTEKLGYAVGAYELMKEARADLVLLIIFLIALALYYYR